MNASDLRGSVAVLVLVLVLGGCAAEETSPQTFANSPICVPRAHEGDAYTFTGSLDRGAGSAFASFDFDGVGPADLAIGVPGFDGEEGRVRICWGVAGAGAAPNGFNFDTGCDDYENPFGRVPGQRFGHSLEMFDDDLGVSWLLVGAPSDSPAQEGAGAVVAMRFTASHLIAGSWELGSTLQSGGRGAVPGFGSSLAVDDFDGDGRTDLAVGSPGADTAFGTIGFEDAGAVEVFFGLAGAGGTGGPGIQPPPFGQTDVSNYRLDAADSPSQAYFGRSLVAVELDGQMGAELAMGAPGHDADRGLVAVLVGIAPATSLMAPSFVVTQGDSSRVWANTPGAGPFTIGASDYLPEGGDEYGWALSRLRLPERWSPELERSPVAGDGPGIDLVIVGAPGESLQSLSDVGTVCVLDLSGAGGAIAQACIDPATGASLPLEPRLRYGSAVLGAAVTPEPMGFEKTSLTWEVRGGAPGFGMQTAGVQLGAVATTHLTFPHQVIFWDEQDDPPFVRRAYSGLPVLRGEDVILGGLQGSDDMGFGSALHSYDVSGGGEDDLVVGAPLLKGGAFGWARPDFSSDPVDARYFQWELADTPGAIGVTGDTMNLLWIELADLPVIVYSVWSDTNRGFMLSSNASAEALSNVGLTACGELLVNMLNTTPWSFDFINEIEVSDTSHEYYWWAWNASGDWRGWHDTSPFWACSGESGAWMPPTLPPDHACAPDEVYRNAIFDHSPQSKCGNTKPRVSYPILFTGEPVEAGKPFIHTHDVSDIVQPLGQTSGELQFEVTDDGNVPVVTRTLEVTKLFQPGLAMELDNATMTNSGSGATPPRSYPLSYFQDFTCE